MRAAQDAVLDRLPRGQSKSRQGAAIPDGGDAGRQRGSQILHDPDRAHRIGVFGGVVEHRAATAEGHVRVHVDEAGHDRGVAVVDYNRVVRVNARRTNVGDHAVANNDVGVAVRVRAGPVNQRGSAQNQIRH